MKYKNIPFNRVDIQGKELEYINETIENAHISGDGIFTHKCNSFLEKELGIDKSLLTTSCTHALEMAIKLLNIKSGDEVIVPSMTFIAPVNAINYNNAKPIFMDCDNFYNLDADKTIQFIKKWKIRA